MNVSKTTSLWLFLTILTGLCAGAAERPLPAPIVWKLESTATIGGHKPEILGTPKSVDAALQFDGLSDGLIVPVNPLAGWATFTIEVLFMPAADDPAAQRFLYIIDERDSRVSLETRNADGKSWCLDTYLLGDKDRCTLRDTTKLHPTGQWTWVALVYDGKTMTHYVNGVKELEREVVFPPMTSGRTSLGVRLDRAYWFKGLIKDVRFCPGVVASEKLQRSSEK